MHMKRLLKTICLLTCAVLLCGAPAAFADGLSYESLILLNPYGQGMTQLMGSPSETSTSMGWFYDGTPVVRHLNVGTSPWAFVTVGSDEDGLTGWIREENLSKAKGPAVPRYVLGDASIALRGGPAVIEPVKHTAYQGATLDHWGVANDWWYVAVDGAEGYIQANQATLTRIGGGDYPGYNTAVINNPNPRDRLNLRVSPSGTAATQGKYYNGVTVEVLDGAQNGFAHVRIGPLTGYMDSKYLLMNAYPGAVVSAMPYVQVANADGTGLNLREGPSTTHPAIRLCRNGTYVTVMGLSERWAHVIADDGTVGFVMLGGLNPRPQFILDAETPEPTPDPGASTGPFDPGFSHPTTSYPLSYTYGMAMVNNHNGPRNRLNLRAAPKKDATSLGKYYTGACVTVLERLTADGVEWALVSIGSRQGYMLTEYLATYESNTYVKPALPVMIVNAPGAKGRLLLRQGPSTNSAEMASIPNGTKVVLLGFGGGWAHVVVEGKMGFMWGDYLD